MFSTHRASAPTFRLLKKKKKEDRRPHQLHFAKDVFATNIFSRSLNSLHAHYILAMTALCFDFEAQSGIRMSLCCSALEERDSFGSKDAFRTSGWLNSLAL